MQEELLALVAGVIKVADPAVEPLDHITPPVGLENDLGVEFQRNLLPHRFAHLSPVFIEPFRVSCDENLRHKQSSSLPSE